MDREAGLANVGEVKPIPLRYWWLKRIGVVAGVVIAPLVGMRLGWGWYAERQLQAEINGYRAAGEPVDLTDFDPPFVADKDNGALPLQAAAKALAGLDPNLVQVISDVADGPELVAVSRVKMRRAIEATADIRTLVRGARSLPGTDWGFRIRSPAAMTMSPSLSGDRQLCKLLRTAATYYHLEQNDDEAIEAIHDMMLHGRHVDRQPFLISHMVVLAIFGSATGAVEEVAPRLRVRDESVGRDGAKPATRRQVEALVRAMFDDGECLQAFVRALQGERATDLDSAMLFAEGRSLFPLVLVPTGPPGLPCQALALVLRPMILLDTVPLMRFETAWVRAAREGCWSAIQACSGSGSKDTSGVRYATRLMSTALELPLDGCSCQHFRSLAMRRMAGVALAIRLYEIDHGRRPETLDELVPKYLASIPPDPFAPDGRRIGYRPHAPRPVLYSVGENGIDEQGQYGLSAGGGVDWAARDLPFFLNGDRPGRTRAGTTTATAPVASSQAVDQ